MVAPEPITGCRIALPRKTHGHFQSHAAMVFLALISCLFPDSVLKGQKPDIRKLEASGCQVLANTTEITVVFPDGVPAGRRTQATPAQLAGLMTVFSADVDPAQLPPVAGEVTIGDSGALVFKPRFALRNGKSYTIFVNGFGAKFETTIKIPESETRKSRIESISPSASAVPENILKFYLYFSQPMQKGDVYSYLQLREAGKTDPIELPFLELEQELWSRDARRLTLLLDPGRIKRGLKPREEVGPILLPGRNYELVISGRWPDHLGRSLGEDVIKTFQTGPYDQSQPDPRLWQISSPPAGTLEPVAVKFREPLDHWMLQRVIRIRNPDGLLVDGKITTEDFDRRWKFTPSVAWQAGLYSMVVDNTLEDLAGNSIGKLFDVDIFRRTGREPDVGQTELGFEIR